MNTNNLRAYIRMVLLEQQLTKPSTQLTKPSTQLTKPSTQLTKPAQVTAPATRDTRERSPADTTSREPDPKKMFAGITTECMGKKGKDLINCIRIATNTFVKNYLDIFSGRKELQGGDFFRTFSHYFDLLMTEKLGFPASSGMGSSRKIYKIGDGKVLKQAMNFAGVQQNQNEDVSSEKSSVNTFVYASSSSSGINQEYREFLNENYESFWIICEEVVPCENFQEIEKIIGVPWDYVRYKVKRDIYSEEGAREEEVDFLEKESFFELVNPKKIGKARDKRGHINYVIQSSTVPKEIMLNLSKGDRFVSMNPDKNSEFSLFVVNSIKENGEIGITKLKKQPSEEQIKNLTLKYDKIVQSELFGRGKEVDKKVQENPGKYKTAITFINNLSKFMREIGAASGDILMKSDSWGIKEDSNGEKTVKLLDWGLTPKMSDTYYRDGHAIR